MSADNLQRRRLVSRRFRPICENLEGLILPSVDVFLHPDNPNKLVIEGDGANDSVIIYQDDCDDTLEVVGHGTYTSSSIAWVVVKLGGGNDLLDYRLEDGSTFRHHKIMTIDPGAGNDVLHFFMQGEEAVIEGMLTIDVGTKASHDLTGNDLFRMYLQGIDDAEVDCNIKLGAGDDTFNTRIMDNLTHAADVTFDVDGGGNADDLEFYALKLAGDANVVIGADAELNVQLDGAGGADDITVWHQGSIFGKLKVDVNGGNGGDDIFGSFVPLDFFGFKSNGYLDANFYGDAGNDHMDLYHNGPTQSLHYSEDELPFIHGGSGIDSYTELMNSSLAEKFSMEVLDGDLVLLG